MLATRKDSRVPGGMPKRGRRGKSMPTKPTACYRISRSKLGCSQIFLWIRRTGRIRGDGSIWLGLGAAWV